MRNTGTPTKIVNLSKLILRETTNKVQIGGHWQTVLILLVYSGKAIHSLPCYWPFKRRVKSHLPFAGSIRSSTYSLH